MSKVIGKPYVGQLGYFTYLNEFGRDSLRVILERFQDKRFLVPDFYCPIIIELMDTMNIDYAFYAVDEDFRPVMEDIKHRKYDIFYYINFSGYKMNHVVPDDKIYLEDNVFLVDFEPNHPKYVGFNSWRKCTPLTSGSMIKSTFKLRDSYWKLPNDQLALLLQGNRTEYQTLLINNRDYVQDELAKQNIFLPVFWRGTNSKLSDRVISIPMDDRYTDEEIEHVEELIATYDK